MAVYTKRTWTVENTWNCDTCDNKNYGSSYVRGNLVPWICHNENSLNVYIYPYIYVKVRDRQELGFPLNFVPSNMAKFSKISSHFWKEFEQWKELNPLLTVRDNHPSR